MSKEKISVVGLGFVGLSMAVVNASKGFFTYGIDINTKKILTLAYSNKESLELTKKTGNSWFWSRSRNKLWMKGEESGNTQKVKEILVDCDSDALIYLVEPSGPACHTGEETCFHNELEK